MLPLFIRIKPDWNVKDLIGPNIRKGVNIRIKPDWNVKNLGTLPPLSYGSLE